MITIISPTKQMKQVSYSKITPSYPVLVDKILPILKTIRAYQPSEIADLMKVNEKIALQTFLDFQDTRIEQVLTLNKELGTPALLAYDGLVFKNIEAEQFTTEELEFANQHLRILSGFYGVLRPFDLILPYRLEMQLKIKVEEKNLYDYWGKTLVDTLDAKEEVIVNLASSEYSKAIKKYVKNKKQFITVDFLIEKDGQYKTLATWAKMARGEMVKTIIKEQLTQPDQLTLHTYQGFSFNKELSTDTTLIFVKPYQNEN